MRIIALLFLVVALSLVGLGLFTMSQATTGVALIGIACALSIWARIAQASAQHQDLMNKLSPPAKPAPMVSETP